jgi:hypothetical protein
VIRLLLFSIIFLFYYPVQSQDFFRIKTDFIIKNKALNGEQQLTVGKIYYDKNIKKIIFDISFPKKEIWVQEDTTLYKIVNSNVIDKQNTPNITEFTIYHLTLNGHLSDYGLKNSNFKIIDIEKDGKNIISTWEPPKELKNVFGSILMLNTDQQLTGIIFKNKDDEIVSRQFFRNYMKIKGLPFPQEIIRENHVEGQILYEITTYSNTIINEYSNEDKYDFKIPHN